MDEQHSHILEKGNRSSRFCKKDLLMRKFEEFWLLFNEKVSDKHPVFQAARIAEEAGEAINLVFKLVGFRREGYDAEEIKKRLCDELADVVITTYVCARVCGLICGER